MNKIHLSILLCVLIGFWACGANDPGAPEPDPRIQQVVDNSRVLRDAVEAFAAQNDGWYPTNLVDVNVAGNTVVDLLPGGQMLENPFTGERTSPVEGVAQNPGDVGYTCLWVARNDDRVWEGRNIDGYRIIGVGQSVETRLIEIRRSAQGGSEEILGDSGPALEDNVLVNCTIVASAAEAFAAGNGGAYPSSLDDTDQGGNTLVDLLPAASRLVNPQTGLNTEPVDWEPMGLGSTAYSALYEYDDNWDAQIVGFRIVGRGQYGDFVISNAPSVINNEQAVVKNCLIAQGAAEAFAADNGGAYAYSDLDVNLVGQTVQDYLPTEGLMENPFTGSATEPLWGGLGLSAGQTGYHALDLNGDGVNDGFEINGTGGHPGTDIFHIYVPPQP
jgi:hypothetical protein